MQRLKCPRPGVLPILLLLGFVLITGSAVHTICGVLRAGPMYSVAAVQAGLGRQRAAWVGRTVWVRAVAKGCGFSVGYDPCQPALVDAAAPASDQPLWLSRGETSPLWTLLRQSPVLARFAPAPQVLHWGIVATYRVRLLAIPESICGTASCYEAALLDPAP